MKSMAQFSGDRGLNVYVDPDEVSQVADCHTNPGTTVVTMKNADKVVIRGLYASEVMRCLELATAR